MTLGAAGGYNYNTAAGALKGRNYLSIAPSGLSVFKLILHPALRTGS
jgi:hypothetical protein